MHERPKLIREKERAREFLEDLEPAQLAAIEKTLLSKCNHENLIAHFHEETITKVVQKNTLNPNSKRANPYVNLDLLEVRLQLSALLPFTLPPPEEPPT